jgi:hypothetical protein
MSHSTSSLFRELKIKAERGAGTDPKLCLAEGRM